MYSSISIIDMYYIETYVVDIYSSMLIDHAHTVSHTSIRSHQWVKCQRQHRKRKQVCVFPLSSIFSTSAAEKVSIGDCIRASGQKGQSFQVQISCATCCWCSARLDAECKSRFMIYLYLWLAKLVTTNSSLTNSCQDFRKQIVDW